MRIDIVLLIWGVEMNRSMKVLIVYLHLIHKELINYNIFCNNYYPISKRSFQYIISDINCSLYEYGIYQEVKFNKQLNSYVLE